MCYQTQMPVIFLILFSDIGQSKGNLVVHYCNYCKILQVLQTTVSTANYCRYCKVLQTTAKYWKLQKITASYCKVLHTTACGTASNTAKINTEYYINEILIEFLVEYWSKWVFCPPLLLQCRWKVYHIEKKLQINP